MRPLETARVHLCRDPVDFRKAINGLSVLVAEELALDPFSAHVFGFCNRRRDQVKLLCWERNGFVLWQKRLEKDRFPWPRTGEGEVLEVTESRVCQIHSQAVLRIRARLKAWLE